MKFLNAAVDGTKHLRIENLSMFCSHCALIYVWTYITYDMCEILLNIKVLSSFEPVSPTVNLPAISGVEVSASYIESH